MDVYQWGLLVGGVLTGAAAFFVPKTFRGIPARALPSGVGIACMVVGNFRVGIDYPGAIVFVLGLGLAIGMAVSSGEVYRRQWVKTSLAQRQTEELLKGYRERIASASGTDERRWAVRQIGVTYLIAVVLLIALLVIRLVIGDAVP
jgi:hypothetical protein